MLVWSHTVFAAVAILGAVEFPASAMCTATVVTKGRMRATDPEKTLFTKVAHCLDASELNDGKSYVLVVPPPSCWLSVS